jgi:hypothetical protein
LSFMCQAHPFGAWFATYVSIWEYGRGRTFIRPETLDRARHAREAMITYILSDRKGFRVGLLIQDSAGPAPDRMAAHEAARSHV